MLRLVTAFQSRFIKEEEGASMVEYGLLVALIAVVAIIAVTAVGTAVSTNFNEVATNL
jgi:pilus assembly protein Flp/PilA